MNFHQYLSLYDLARLRGLVTQSESASSYYARLMKTTGEIGPVEVSSSMLCHFLLECSWWKSSRPYYKVWPSIAESLNRMNLDVRGSGLSLSRNPISIRFAQSIEPVAGATKIHAMAARVTAPEIDGDSFLLLSANVEIHGERFIKSWPRVHLCDETLEEWVSRDIPILSDARSSAIVSPDHQQLSEVCLRNVLTVLLLANDPSVVQPDVLAKDRDMFDQTTDEVLRQRLIDKAKRKGIVGWRIGESYETIPHYRRPHFGLRYTGTGGTVPRIVPIKGAVVHRQKLTQVPTGYIRPDGTEAE